MAQSLTAATSLLVGSPSRPTTAPAPNTSHIEERRIPAEQARAIQDISTDLWQTQGFSEMGSLGITERCITLPAAIPTVDRLIHGDVPVRPWGEPRLVVCVKSGARPSLTLRWRPTGDLSRLQKQAGDAWMDFGGIDRCR